MFILKDKDYDPTHSLRYSAHPRPLPINSTTHNALEA